MEWQPLHNPDLSLDPCVDETVARPSKVHCMVVQVRVTQIPWQGGSFSYPDNWVMLPRTTPQRCTPGTLQFPPSRTLAGATGFPAP